MNNGVNDHSAKRFEIDPVGPSVTDVRGEAGEDAHGIDRGVDRSAWLKGSVRRKAMQLERDVLVRVLCETGGNEAQAARMLQMDCDTIHRKLRQYGIRGK